MCLRWNEGRQCIEEHNFRTYLLGDIGKCLPGLAGSTVFSSSYCNPHTFSRAVSHRSFPQKSDEGWRCFCIKMLEAPAVLNKCALAIWVTVLHSGAIWCRVMGEKSRVIYGEAATDGPIEGQIENRQKNWEAERICLSGLVSLSSSVCFCPSLHLFIYLSHSAISLPLTSLSSVAHQHGHKHRDFV